MLMDTHRYSTHAPRYNAFGETIIQSGAAINKYQYAGEQYDRALGDYYLRQWFYDASNGRFIRQDT
ncbi:hypothetical protein H6G21_14955 [Alkalinema sp. FACHB-956]|nr:hypothetical protein [Alkalinema sp. FACHB-956]